jgi:hypothetical protein
MVKKDDYRTGFNDGYEEATKDSKSLTKDEFAKLAYLLGQDGYSDHEGVGVLVWKLSNRVKEEEILLHKEDD